jgi:hypothetical protein
MSIITDPKKFMKLNAYLTVFWIIMVPISVLMGWVNSVAYVSALSIYALMAAHLSTYAAARTEVMQSDQASETHEAVKRLRKIDEDHPADEPVDEC